MPNNLDNNYLLEKLREPLSDKRTISVSTRVLYTDVNGQIIDKATLPANLQTKMPLFFWGEYDRQGGYFAAQRENPADPNGWLFLTSLIWGANAVSLGFILPGLNDIQGQIVPGDMVCIWTDSLVAPSQYAFVIQSVNLYSWGSILANTKSSIPDFRFADIKIEKFQYFTDNQANWKQRINILFMDRIGNFISDKASPMVYRYPNVINNQLAEVLIGFDANQYIGLNTYWLFDTTFITFNFQLKIRQ